MKVSVITVTYNSGKTIRDAVESIARQTHPDIEYIIIDGKSTDDTLDILSQYPNVITRLISEPDRGIYDAMNKGLANAKGDIIGFLNSDDMFYDDNTVSLIVDAFESDASIQAVHGDLYYVKKNDTSKKVRHWRSSQYHDGAFCRGWHPAHPTFYARRECFECFGGFRLDLPLSADFELMLRLIEVHHIKTTHIPHALIRMRIGGASSKNFRSIIHGIIQCRHAFHVNNINYPLTYPIRRLIPKIKQFFC